MQLQAPFFISSRLMAAVEIGGATVGIEPTGRTDHRGAPEYRWTIDLPDGREFEGDRLNCWQGPQAAFETLLTFLGAFAEARSEASDNWDMFPDGLREWAQANGDEFSMLECELEESTGLLTA